MGTQGCFDPLNDLSVQSYPMLAVMLDDLAHELPGMAYSLGDAFTMVSFVFANPRTKDWSNKQLTDILCVVKHRFNL
jgi:hypothetical protein